MQPTVTFPSFTFPQQPARRRAIVLEQPAPSVAAKPARKAPCYFERMMGATPKGFLREYVADVKHVVGLAPARDRDSKGRFIKGNRYRFESVSVGIYEKTYRVAMQPLRFGVEVAL